MKTRKSRIITALALTGIVGAGGLYAGTNAYGALGIDTTKKDCSIQFSVPEAKDASYQDLSIDQIPITLYKVADVNVSGNYTVDSAYPSLDLKSISSTTTAAEWQEKALAAFGDLKSDSEHETNGEDGNYSDTIGSLSTGMYLAVPGEMDVAGYEDYEYGIVLTDEHVYEFSPYLIAVPGNNYNPEEEGSDDAWIYDVDSVLKMTQSDRSGSLQITKTLDTYNESLEGATFVYQIEAVKNSETVYSNVVSLTFTGAGTQNVEEVTGIPAGSDVTVTEVYSGSAYEVVGEGTKTVEKITADEISGVEFENTYNQGVNHGSAVDNHFVKEGEQMELYQNGELYQN